MFFVLFSASFLWSLLGNAQSLTVDGNGLQSEEAVLGERPIEAPQAGLVRKVVDFFKTEEERSPGLLERTQTDKNENTKEKSDPSLPAGTLTPDPKVPQVGYLLNLRLTGIEVLDQKIKLVSTLIAKQSEGAVRRGVLRQRILRDKKDILRLLHSEGYYGAQVNISVLDEKRSLPQLALDVRAGRLFRYGPTKVLTQSQVDLSALFKAQKVVLLPQGQPAKASAVLVGQTKLKLAFANNAYPFARIQDRKVYVDHKTGLMSLEWTVDSGQLVAFGETRIKGLKKVKPSVIYEAISWKKGESFSLDKIEETEARLRKLNLFSSIFINVEEGQGHLRPITITLKERKFNTFNVAAGYDSNIGPKARIYWVDRNFSGIGDTLSVSALAAFKRQSLRIEYTRPALKAFDLLWKSSAYGVRDETRSIVEYKIGAVSKLQKKFQDNLMLSAGLGVEAFREETVLGSENYLLAFAPFELAYDRTDDLLDPTKGVRLKAEVTPYSNLRSGETFIRSEAKLSAYVPLDQDGTYVFAGWGRYGSITGVNLSSVPLGLRFFSGGNDSVRGFSYRDISPKTLAGSSSGGQSLFEFGGELRYRPNEKWGFVGFLEAGQVYQTAQPTGGAFEWGTGLGVRYFTDFGPVRFDLAAPVQTDNLLKDFRVYFSIGQAF